MRHLSALSLALFLSVTSLAAVAPAAAETALPKEAKIDKTAKALKTFAPTVNPGHTDFDAADRAAIANLLYAYSFAYDNYEADAWFELFTPEVYFVAGMPGTPSLSFQGDDFRKFWRQRMADFKTSGNQRRHLMSNILFLDQTETTAHISVAGLLTNVKDGKTASFVSSLNYEGWLVKGEDGWKIKRWHDFPDAAF